MSFRVVIPARYASTRLPRKPLLDIAGKPMLRHAYERALESGAASVVIATDHEEIRDCAQRFGAEVCMTSETHPSGSERIAEVAARLGYGDDELVVNLQGDEPLMPPTLIRQVAENLAARPAADMATLCTPIETAEDLFNPNVVKVVMDRQGFALYFSRAPIPWDRDAFAASTRELPAGAIHYRHLGLYGYRVGYLRRYVALAPCDIERRESLEQLRVLWNGGRIHLAEAACRPGPGVDTLADLERVRALLTTA